MRRPLDGVANTDGGVAAMAAAAGTLMCALAALVVDLGSLALSARTLQGVADLAALSAASDLDRAPLAAEATARANLDPVIVAVETGVHVADAAVAPDRRFTPGAAAPNAARVTLTRASPLYFGRWILGRDTVVQTRRATASIPRQPPRAMFSIGSRLAALDGGIANQLLSGLTGSTVSLSAMDYSALASARVNLLGASDAFATDLAVQAGDYDRLLSHEIDAGRALELIRDLPGDQGDAALGRLVRSATGVRVALSDLIALEAEAEDGIAEGLDAEVSVLDLVMAMLETGGDRQVALNLGAQAGLADLTIDLAIGERPNNSPWLTVTGEATPIVRTAQARLYVRARTAQKLSGLAQVHLPILIEMAASEARLQDIDCAPRAVTLGVRPGLASAAIGAIDEADLDDFKRRLSPSPATLLSVLGLVTVTGSAEVEAADVGFRSVRFSDADIRARTTKTVTANSLTQGVIASLIGRLDVDVRAVGLGLGLNGLASALGTLLTPLGPVLDGAINPVLDLLGLRLGQADVTVHGATCPDPARRRPVLVA